MKIPPPRQKKSILVIDDNQDLLLCDKIILERAGHEVLTAASGKEGLTTLAENPAPDLILLDMRMYDMSGPEFLEALEKQKPEIIENVPIVFFTNMDEVPESKASGFIRKDKGIEGLLEGVHHFLEFS
jgi:two-component system OmpR family response regulator